MLNNTHLERLPKSVFVDCEGKIFNGKVEKKPGMDHLDLSGLQVNAD